MEENKNINVDDLNGIGEAVMKVITKTIQEPDPIRFSLLCEEQFKTINPEALITYSIANLQLQTNRGVALIYVANFQYWAMEKEHKQWIDDLKRSNLFIKP